MTVRELDESHAKGDRYIYRMPRQIAEWWLDISGVFRPKSRMDRVFARAFSVVSIAAIVGMAVAEAVCVGVIASGKVGHSWYQPLVLNTTLPALFLIGLFGVSAAANPFTEEK